MTVKPTPPGERLARRLVLDPSTGCLNWTGPTLHNGYGQMGIPPKVNGRTPRIRVHRLAYELAYGPIPEGMHIDHLCRNRLCCNPQHLEVVTPGENTRRGDSPSAISARTGLCQKGHMMDEANTLIGGTKNTRACRKCQLARKAEHLRRWRASRRMNPNPTSPALSKAVQP